MATTATKPRNATKKAPRKGTAKKAPAKKATGRRTPGNDPNWAKNMAIGREASRAVNAYLEVLDRPHRRIPSDKKLARLRRELPAASGLKRVVLIQQLADAEEVLVTATDGGAELKQAEEGFVKHAAIVSENKNIGYATWREVGVPARVLKLAGIKQTRLA